LCANEFLSHTSDPAGQFYDCPVPGGSAIPECQAYTGVFIMNALGFQIDWISKRFVIIAALITAFYTGAGLVFKFKKVDIEIAKARTTQTPVLGKGEHRVSPVTEKGRTIDIILDKCSLDVKKRGSFGTQTTTKSILKPITTKFESGTLNVVMGPSGSGKTSLLNLMARRLYNSASTRYLTGGEMLYGGAVPSDDVVRSVSSYVCQDDDALLPTLTVRETLHFAAGLRLPTWMSKQEKIQRAESVLLKLGLRDCADNLIGNDLIKGISGGEKRRVTIAVQILTEPRILLLDEPTSGLDAFTAASIIECLRGLAEEGRTLVLTIHQPSSNLFRSFGNILLLARGGFPVYAGKGDAMLSYFSTLGFKCTETMNPADFALDLITVNLQQASKEAITRDRVQFLVSDWEKTGAAGPVTSQISTPAELGSLKRAMTPFRMSFPLLIRRSFINFRRDPNAIIARTTQVLGFGVFMALFFAPLKSDYESIQSRFGFIQEFVGELSLWL
jgi:ABC-type multidrug transport system ATPase subunit